MGRVARFLAATTLALGFLFTTSPAVAEDVWWAQESWEGSSVTLTAPDGWQFVYGRAWYGDPNNLDCGADVSSIFEGIIIGQTSVTLNLDNNTFGDPCPGYYKVTRFTWGIVPLVIEPTPEPTPITEPTPQPSPEPTQEPSPQPSPIEQGPAVTEQPTAPVEPEPTPIEPSPEPSPQPSVEPKPEITPPVIIPTPQPTPENSPEPSQEPTSEPSQKPTQGPTPEPTQEPEVPAELANIPVIGAVASAVLDAFNALGNIGNDMTPEQRKESQQVIVASVIVGQITTLRKL